MVDLTTFAALVELSKSMKCYNEYHTIENSGTLEEYKRQKTSNSVEPVNIRKICETTKSV